MSADHDPVLSPCHCGMLRQASRHLSQIYDTALAPTGLKITQLSVLVAIERESQNAPTLSVLADMLVMDRSALSRNLRLLERDGLVAIVTSKTDARGRHVALTAAGQAKIDQARTLWTDVQKRLEEAFGSRATEQLRAALARLTTTNIELPVG